MVSLRELRISRRWLLVAIAWSIPALAQENIWASVRTDWKRLGRDYAETVLEAPQEKSIIQLLKSLPSPWGCSEDEGQWLKSLRYTFLPLASKKQIVLVEAGPGCASGAQNHAMWLIRFDRQNPILLVGEEQGFGGLFFAVAKKTSKGYRDVILRWHNSAFDSGLTYYRFDGKVYHPLASATLYSEDPLEIVPAKPAR